MLSPQCQPERPANEQDLTVRLPSETFATPQPLPPGSVGASTNVDPILRLLEEKRARAGQRLGAAIMQLYGPEWQTCEDLGEKLYPDAENKYVARHRTHGMLGALRRYASELLHPELELQMRCTGNLPGMPGSRTSYRIMPSGTRIEDATARNPTYAERVVEMLQREPGLAEEEVVRRLYGYLPSDHQERRALILNGRNHISGARRLLRNQGQQRTIILGDDGLYYLGPMPETYDI